MSLQRRETANLDELAAPAPLDTSGDEYAGPVPTAADPEEPSPRSSPRLPSISSRRRRSHSLHHGGTAAADHASTSSSIPYAANLGEVGPDPVQNPDERRFSLHTTLEDFRQGRRQRSSTPPQGRRRESRSRGRRRSRANSIMVGELGHLRRHPSYAERQQSLEMPDRYANLDELGPPPIDEPYEDTQPRTTIRRRATIQTPPPNRRATATGGGAPRESSAIRRRRSSVFGSESPEAGGGDEHIEFDLPDNFANLDGLAGPSPLQNPHEAAYYRHRSLEESRAWEKEHRREELERRRSRGASLAGELQAAQAHVAAQDAARKAEKERLEALAQQERPWYRKYALSSTNATQLYTVSYLIFFSIFGTLARLGLQWLTMYPGAPVAMGELWANFAGSLFMGFLSEDRKLFREEWGKSVKVAEAEAEAEAEADAEGDTTTTTTTSTPPNESPPNGESNGASSSTIDDTEKQAGQQEQPPPPPPADRAALLAAHVKVKKTLPLFIGLATGFCGSFTTFSSFMRDTFLALSNNLPTPVSHPSPVAVSSSSTVPRNGGYSFMAVLAVLILTLCLCMSALKIGAHLALLLEPVLPTLPFLFMRKVFDRVMVFVAWTSWLGAVFLAIWPPDRSSSSKDHWRGEAVFAIVFAPLGCLLRFYLSLLLNGLVASFPLGTFTVNVFGTAVLGMAYDLQHVRLPAGGGGSTAASLGIVGGGVTGCQVLQGIMDGFCGCLTTVSTWVMELNGLRRRHAYVYGLVSVGVSLALLVLIMGSVRWTVGWSSPVCSTGAR
ncbi:hypothetical protein L228DRAFT_279707 [Xylona heveae TC161]|uniref:Chromosome condensation protein n=1 Tax=Xylona heveae (strain CBS 132557 / TC161) TaxID=1328760 RepID=A0A165JQR3_XYLHT|nr:hypothetical protein L228DRAFT_279707 [Xylona heveae TC161]KZF26520.1 hypothetical protein L228DRAFT_279707 [Xylona heveae TC161]